MMEADDDRHGQLVLALVGPHQPRYIHDPQFRHSIDLLAGMLPPMIEGLVDAAERNRERREAQVRRLTEGPTVMRLTRCRTPSCPNERPTVNCYFDHHDVEVEKVDG